MRSVVLGHHKIWKIIFEFLIDEGVIIDQETMNLMLVAAVA